MSTYQEADLNKVAEDLLKINWSNQFKSDKTRFLAKNAIAILYHIITHDKNDYGVDDNYLLEKATKIVDEIKSA